MFIFHPTLSLKNIDLNLSYYVPIDLLFFPENDIIYVNINEISNNWSSGPIKCGKYNTKIGEGLN